MNDRELLEAAARAAGIEIDKTEFNGGGAGNTGFDVLGNVVLDWHNGKTWNPLTDDGDALRLAVKLNLTCRFYFGNSCAQATTPNMPIAYEDVQNSADPMAGARLAIVRAAAAMAG